LRVFIPCAGLGTRAKVSTETLPKPLISISGKPLIARVIEQYPQDTDFVIALGYKKDIVKQFLDKYKEISNKKITYTYTDSWQQSDMGLTNTLLDARSELNCKFVFNACDTLILGKDIDDLIGSNLNLVIQAQVTSSGFYRSIANDSWKISKFSQHSSDPAYVGVSMVADFEYFWRSLLEKSLASPEDGETLGLNPKDTKILEINQKNWLDCGAPDGIERARKHFQSKDIILPKDNEATWNFENTMLKIHTDSEFITNRVKRSVALQPFVPKITYNSKNIYTYTRFDGQTLSKCDKPIFNHFLKYMEDFWFHFDGEPPKKNFTDYLSFYQIKTFSRIDEFSEKYGKLDLNFINGRKVKSVDNLLKELNWNEICEPHITRAHGDLHPDNVLYSAQEKKFMLLDWRQDIANCVGKFGDLYYDFAKLNHGLIIDHGIVSNSKFKVSIRNNHAEYSIDFSNKKIEWQKEFYAYIELNNYNLEKVIALTGIIFLNIATLHHDPYCKLLYILGQEVLNDLVASETAK
jgi:choline kinase